jgi:hypothetical protein
MSKPANTTSSTALDTSWLEADSSSALNALASAGANASALIDAWVKHGNAAAVAAVAEHGQGAPRKAARRAVNVLKARGISVPEQRRISAVGGARAPETFEAWITPPDSGGSALVVIAARSPTSRYRAAFVFFHEAAGILRVETGELSQSQLRETWGRILPSGQQRPIRVPVEWARARVATARARHAKLGTPEPLGLGVAQPLLEPVPAEAPTHPFDEEGLELSDEDAQDLVKSSAKLHELPEFRPWFPAREAIDELLTKLGERLEPGTEPDPQSAAQNLQEEIRAATDRYFSPQRRSELIAAMKDAALGVLQRDGEVRALEVVAAMKVIEKAGLITDPPHEVPFLRAFFDKAVAVLLAQGGGSLRVPVPARPPTSEP